jgi:hypothetical protein
MDARILRLGAVAGVLGLAVQVGASALHPGHSAPNDSAAVFQEYAVSPIWTAVHIGQFAGVMLTSLALLALAGSLPKHGAAGGFAFLGGIAAALVGAVFAVQMAVDGVALKGAIDGWMAAAPADRTAAFLVADGVRWIEKGLGGFFQLLNGTAILALGIAVASGRSYPRWLGWVGVVAGLGFMSGGVATAHTGFSPEAGQILSPALLLGVVFLLGMSASMWRRARLPDTSATVSPRQGTASNSLATQS